MQPQSIIISGEECDGLDRMAASYINFYIANGGNIHCIAQQQPKV